MKGTEAMDGKEGSRNEKKGEEGEGNRSWGRRKGKRIRGGTMC